MIIFCASGKNGDPRCRASGAEDSAQRRVSIGKKEQKHNIGGKEANKFLNTNIKQLCNSNVFEKNLCIHKSTVELVSNLKGRSRLECQ